MKGEPVQEIYLLVCVVMAISFVRTYLQARQRHGSPLMIASLQSLIEGVAVGVTLGLMYVFFGAGLFSQPIGIVLITALVVAEIIFLRGIVESWIQR
jgi:O-antigen/teichoic acid export membrane protein